MGLRPWGSFEALSDLVRQAVVWAGLPDPGDTRQELADQADAEATTLRALLAGWQAADPDGAGMTVSEAVRLVSEHPKEYQTLRDALFELAATKDGRAINPRAIGVRFHHLRRRVMAGLYLDRRTRHNTAVWFVQQVNQGGTGGTGGTFSAHLAGARAHAHTHAREDESEGPPAPPSPPLADSNEAEQASYEEFMR